MARNLNCGKHLILCKSLFFPETFRQCLETGDNNRTPAQSCAYNSFISVWFMMENYVNDKHSSSIRKYQNSFTAIIVISTFIMTSK